MSEKFQNLQHYNLLARTEQLEREHHQLQTIDVDERIRESSQQLFEDEEKKGFLFNQLREAKTLQRLAIFSEDVLLDLKHSIEPFANEQKKGPKPKISIIDSIVRIRL